MPTPYESKLKDELPRGSYPRDPADSDQQEMGIWGRKLDGIEAENLRLLEGIASPSFAPEWVIEGYETLYLLTPLPSDTLAIRQAAVIAAMGLHRNLSLASFQAIANGFLGYSPTIKTSPHAFYLSHSTFDGGHKLVADHIKFAFLVELDAAQTTKPYDDAALIAALLASAPAEVRHIWTYWSDEAFDWNAYTP